VAVVGRGDTLTAALLRKLTGLPVVERTPCQAAMETARYRAVVVENFSPARRGTLSGCAVARWELSRRTEVTVVGLDDGEGRRLAAALPGVYAYSDGRPQAQLTAKNVRLRGGRLEFEALTDGELLRVRVDGGAQPRLYDHLAALAGALALGVPLREAAARLAR
jgi:UDP-N-acetylmuramyl pentapeptide synthase